VVTHGDVGAGGEDAHATAPRVGEGGVAEPRREPLPALAPRHVRVHCPSPPPQEPRRPRGRGRGGTGGRPRHRASRSPSPAEGLHHPLGRAAYLLLRHHQVLAGGGATRRGVRHGGGESDRLTIPRCT